MTIIATKTPDEVKSFSIDWTKDLAGDVIASAGQSLWSAIPAGITVTQSTLTNNGTLTTVWLSGGVIGQIYEVKNSVTTAAGRTLTKLLRLLVEEGNYL